MKPQIKSLFFTRNIMFTVMTLIILFIGLWWWKSASIVEEDYASFTRADRHYSVVVTRKRSGIGLMPGHAGDSPGTVRLLDRAGKIIRKIDVEMVQLVDHVDWRDKKASIKLVVEWDLPD